MLKRPKLIKYLIIAYLIFAIYSLIMYISMASTPIDAMDVLENTNSFSVDTINSFIILFQFVLMFALFYNLLALNVHGYILQMTFSAFYIFMGLTYIFSDKKYTLITYFSDMPNFSLVLWIIFNAYLIYYFLQPNIIEIFTSKKKQKNILDKELEELINHTSTLINKRAEVKQEEHLQTNNIIKTRRLPKHKYMKNTRILIAEPKNLEELNEIQELNKLIDLNAMQIIVMMKKILPQLKENEVIDDHIYRHYKIYSWDKEEVIRDFKMRASQLCKDKSTITDKMFKYSMKIDEKELLYNTEKLMANWLEDTGNEIGDLISYTYI